MRAGQLRHIINIERKVESRDSFGASLWSWQTFAANVPAAIEPLQGREFFAAQQMQNAISARIRTRYLPGVRSSMRVRHEVEVGAGSPSVVRYYNIEAVLNTDERNRELQLMCTTSDADGFATEKSATAPAIIVTPPYLASATHYDGVGDYYEQSGALAGSPPVAANGVIVSFFGSPEIDLATGTQVQIVSTFQHLTAGFAKIIPYLSVAIYNDSGYGGASDMLRIFIDAESPGVYTYSDIGITGISDLGGAFRSFLYALDFQTGVAQLYIDDVNYVDTNSYSGNSGPTTLDFTALRDLRVGARGHQVDPGSYLVSNFYKGCLSELWFDGVAAVPDFSIESNRRKFISADLKPVSLGANGELPFGTAPIFYSPEGNGTNLGTGGDLTAFGAPSVCGSAP